MQIRDTIELARHQEASDHALETYISSKVPQLHRNICIPKENATRSLMEFITRYIEHVPNVIDALRDMTQASGTYDFAREFLDVGESYFSKPPDFISQKHSGMQALIDQAYMAHRLIEEVNDRMMMIWGMPLAPMDMTKANLIIHDILGERFANELDIAVSYAVEAIFSKLDFANTLVFQRHADLHRETGFKQELEQWPCLAGDSSIFLVMNEGDVKPTLH